MIQSNRPTSKIELFKNVTNRSILSRTKKLNSSQTSLSSKAPTELVNILDCFLLSNVWAAVDLKLDTIDFQESYRKVENYKTSGTFIKVYVGEE